MRQVVEICLGFVELITAELDQSKKAVLNLGIALGLVFAAVLFLICAIGLMLYAVYLSVLAAFDPKWAIFVTALGALGCAGILLWIAAHRGGR
jgi:uncharacterized membrane protein YqjE